MTSNPGPNIQTDGSGHFSTRSAERISVENHKKTEVSDRIVWPIATKSKKSLTWFKVLADPRGRGGICVGDRLLLAALAAFRAPGDNELMPAEH